MSQLELDADAMDTLLASIVDSFEKLEVVVHLYRTRTAQSASTIGASLRFSPHVVVDALAALSRAGIVRTADSDGAGWWIDPTSGWATTIEVLVELYEHDRAELLGLMRRVAIARMRGAGRMSPHAFGRRRRKPVLPS